MNYRVKSKLKFIEKSKSIDTLNYQLFTLLFLYKNKSRNRNLGFTLIELLIVVIILGILAAIATPTLVNQVGKAREAEAKTSLGVLARSQQAYHFEFGTFFSGGNISDFAEIGVGGQYYNYTGDATATDAKAVHSAYATNPQDSNARDFAIGTYYLNGGFSQVFCVAKGVDNDGTTSSVTAPNTSSGTCTGGTAFK